MYYLTRSRPPSSYSPMLRSWSRLSVVLLCLSALLALAAQTLHCEASPSMEAPAEAAAAHTGCGESHNELPCGSGNHCCHAHSHLVMLPASPDSIASPQVENSVFSMGSDSLPESPAREIEHPPQLS